MSSRTPPDGPAPTGATPDTVYAGYAPATSLLEPFMSPEETEELPLRASHHVLTNGPA